jgi:uncharacterized protein (DUF433 family)
LPVDSRFFARCTFVGGQLTLGHKNPISGWSPQTEWSALFKERVAEPRRLIFLSYSQVVKREAMDTMKAASLESDARNYFITVADTFRNAAKEYPSINVDPEVRAGAPCIAGTRIPVYMVLDALEYHGTLEGVLKSYPRLTLDQVKDAIGFSKHVVECPIGDEA